MTYDHLNTTELRDGTLAAVLVSVDADFRLLCGNRTVYEEPYLPVVELARSLDRWIAQPDGKDFVFDSMSFEELGAVIIRQTDAGWVIGSVFAPGVTSDPAPWAEVEDCARVFVAKVKADLAGAGIDPDQVVQE